MDQQFSPPVDVESVESDLLLPPHPSLALLKPRQPIKKAGPARAYIAGRVLLGSMFLLFSAGMVLYNKHLMHKDRFPFAPFLVLCHMVVTLVLAFSFWLLRPEMFPMATAVLRGGELAGLGQKGKGPAQHLLASLVPFFPLAALGAACLIFSNSAYRYNSVSELQMVKETSIVMVYVMSVAAGVEVPRLRNACVLTAVAFSAMLAVCGEAHMLMTGLALQFLASVSQSLQVVLTSSMMDHRDGPRVDPLTMVLCTAPAMLCMLLPLNYIMWDPLIVARLQGWWPQVAGSGLMAFGLQVLTALTIRELSATGVTLVSVVKDLAIVGSAAFLLHERLTNLQLCGFAGTITGISVYSWMKSRPDLS